MKRACSRCMTAVFDEASHSIVGQAPLSATRTLAPAGLGTVFVRAFQMVIARLSSPADDEGGEAVFRVDGSTDTPFRAVQGRLRALLDVG